ncbi:MAG: hypothetical protein B7X55_04605 [Rhodobacterales bacterium 34-62-10]|nr:MAG: hypothetical protein B7X55_04605 [Rhodobacterales bacterium 34-62-10]
MRGKLRGKAAGAGWCDSACGQGKPGNTDLRRFFPVKDAPSRDVATAVARKMILADAQVGQGCNLLSRCGPVLV